MDSEGEDVHDLVEVREEKKHQRPYQIVSEKEIKQLYENEVSDVCSVLIVSRAVAATLLHQNKWSTAFAYDKWFAGPSPPAETYSFETIEMICKICEEYQPNMTSASCGHLFCDDCWGRHMGESIKEGRSLVCPEPGCKSRPGSDMVDSLASAEDRESYYQYLYRSYVESKTRSCPSPGCDLAIVFDSDSDSCKVTCSCGFKLCSKCGEEFHSPLDCAEAKEWMEKNNSDGENTLWILEHTTPCPMCHMPIEKYSGCNHMVCSCGFEFCWVCLDSWLFHLNKCNKPKEMIPKKSWDRYTQYYEKWDSNVNAWKRALAQLEIVRGQLVKKLSLTQEESVHKLQCIVEAWEQIVECWRVLKWSSAIGYYLSEGKLVFLDHLLGEAEVVLERLHCLADKEMAKYLKDDCPSEDFKDFCTNLYYQTSVTKIYFRNLVRALENRLCEVVENRLCDVEENRLCKVEENRLCEVENRLCEVD